jgi:glyoxylase I family protein
MSVSGPLSHIDMSVGYPEKSIPFYDALLSSIGYRRWHVDEPDWSGKNPRRAAWSIECADGSRFGIEVRPARTESRDRRYDRYEPGPHHLAFHAESQMIVDRAHQAVLAIGGEVLDAPAEYGGHPAYGEQYYAVFFSDPDGMKLEVCYVKAANP